MQHNGLSIYQQAMGAAFDRLDPAVQAFHRLAGSHELQGWAETAAPLTWPARMLGRLLGTPMEDSTGAIRFVLHAGPDGETWTRHYTHRKMTSQLRLRDGHVVEALGPTRLHFALHERDGALVMALLQVRVFGIRCPRWLMPDVIAKESGRDNELNFHVRADVRGLGRIAHYKGHLVLPKAYA